MITSLVNVLVVSYLPFCVMNITNTL